MLTITGKKTVKKNQTPKNHPKQNIKPNLLGINMANFDIHCVKYLAMKLEYGPAAITIAIL